MLKQDMVYKKEDFIGLDIGATSLKIVQLKKKKNLTKLVNYDSRDISNNLIIEGIISEPEAVAKVIKEMLEKNEHGRFTAQKVIASIPDSNLFTRVLEFPDMSPKDLKEAIYWEADQSIPMANTDLVLDWQVLGPSISKNETNDVLLVAAPRSIVNSYVQLFQCLDLKAEAIETSMAAISRSLVSNKEKDEVVLITDFGGKSITLAMYDSVLRFSDSLDFGGEKMTEVIEKSLSITKKEAIKLKMEEGLFDDKVKTSLMPLMETIKREMERVMRYHNEKSGGKKKTQKIILSGGFSPMPGLSEYFADALKLEVKIGNPWVNIDTYPLKSIPKTEAPGYANAIGLCLRGLEEQELC